MVTQNSVSQYSTSCKKRRTLQNIHKYRPTSTVADIQVGAKQPIRKFSEALPEPCWAGMNIRTVDLMENGQHRHLTFTVETTGQPYAGLTSAP